MNPTFKPQFQKEFPNKMSRVLIACDDGTDRTQFAWEQLGELVSWLVGWFVSWQVTGWHRVPSSSVMMMGWATPSEWVVFTEQCIGFMAGVVGGACPFVPLQHGPLRGAS